MAVNSPFDRHPLDGPTPKDHTTPVNSPYDPHPLDGKTGRRKKVHTPYDPHPLDVQHPKMRLGLQPVQELEKMAAKHLPSKFLNMTNRQRRKEGWPTRTADYIEFLKKVGDIPEAGV